MKFDLMICLCPYCSVELFYHANKSEKYWSIILSKLWESMNNNSEKCTMHQSLPKCFAFHTRSVVNVNWHNTNLTVSEKCICWTMITNVFTSSMPVSSERDLSRSSRPRVQRDFITRIFGATKIRIGPSRSIVITG